MSNHHGNVILYFDVTLPIPDKLDSSDEKTLEEWAKRRAFNPVRLVQKLRYSDWEYGDDLLFEMRGGREAEAKRVVKTRWENATRNTNTRATCFLDDGSDHAIGRVEKWSRSSKNLRPFVYVQIGKWAGELDLTPLWETKITELDEATRLVDQFWADFGSPFLRQRSQ